MSDPAAYVKCGDYIILYQTASRFTISLPPNTGDNFTIQAPNDDSTKFYIQSYTFSGPSTQDISPDPVGAIVYAGSFVRFMPTTSSYMATGSGNDVIWRSGNPATTRVDICSEDDSGEPTGYGIWAFVTPDCKYDFKKDNQQRIDINSPIYYNKDFYIQNIGQQSCSTNNQNVFLYADSQDAGLGNISLDATAITASDCPQDELNRYYWRAISVNNVMQINLASLVSGYYFTILNAANGLIVFQQDMGNNDGSTGIYGFDGDSDQVGPGDEYSTFLVKKVNLSTGTFYTSNDPDGVIYPGDLLCFFGKGPGGQDGLVYTADEPVNSIIAGATSQNNIVNKNDVTVYNGSNGCGKDGSFFALWVFVEIDGSGNVSQGGPSLSRPVQYGRQYYIQNYGQYNCFSVKQDLLGMQYTGYKSTLLVREELPI